MTALGATFGKYFLTEKIATGGMAEIYLAKLIGPGGFEKQLVLKLIHPELSDHQQFVEMFVAEAKTLVALTHGNLVPVYELGVVDGTYFLAMEYIDGPALAALVAEITAAGEKATPEIAAYVTAELLKGLDYAHRKGESVIHRDVSPRNVMVSREGEVKLVDFGLAVTELSQATRSKQTSLPAGSFPYMSPEQVRQEPLDRTTDLFSAGVVLWEMLTGEYLFHRDTADATLEAVLSDPIPAPSSLRSELPEALDRICAKALARDRTNRYQSASAFLADINRYLYSLEAPPSPADVAKLVARRCPPSRRAAVDGASAAPPQSSAGPHTRPMTARVDNGTAPMPSRGKGRAPTATFATHVALEEFANATPLFPIKALDEALAKEDAMPAGQAAPGEEAAAPEPRAATAKPTRLATVGEVGANWLLRIAGLGALVAAGVALGLFLASPPQANKADAGATPAIADAAAPIDAAPPDAAPPDAAPIDAAPAPIDAGRRRRPDAAPRPRGNGELRVGAKPWADVYVDGKKLGQAPGHWTIPAGRHVVEVRYPVPGREQSRRFNVSLQPDQTETLGVIDFTKP